MSAARHLAPGRPRRASRRRTRGWAGTVRSRTSSPRAGGPGPRRGWLGGSRGGGPASSASTRPRRASWILARVAVVHGDLADRGAERGLLVSVDRDLGALVEDVRRGLVVVEGREELRVGVAVDAVPEGGVGAQGCT